MRPATGACLPKGAFYGHHKMKQWSNPTKTSESPQYTPHGDGSGTRCLACMGVLGPLPRSSLFPCSSCVCSPLSSLACRPRIAPRGRRKARARRVLLKGKQGLPIAHQASTATFGRQHCSQHLLRLPTKKLLTSQNMQESARRPPPPPGQVWPPQPTSVTSEQGSFLACIALPNPCLFQPANCLVPSSCGYCLKPSQGSGTIQ